MMCCGGLWPNPATKSSRASGAISEFLFRARLTYVSVVRWRSQIPKKTSQMLAHDEYYMVCVHYIDFRRTYMIMYIYAGRRRRHEWAMRETFKHRRRRLADNARRPAMFTMWTRRRARLTADRTQGARARRCGPAYITHIYIISCRGGGCASARIYERASALCLCRRFFRLFIFNPSLRIELSFFQICVRLVSC